jgi:hypothetical protein
MKMRKRRLQKALLLATAVSLAAFLSLQPAFAAGSSGMRLVGTSETGALSGHFGVVASHLLLNDSLTMEKQLDAMAEAGIKWVRCAFTWPDLERKQGTWDFSKADLLMGEAEERGIQILAILGGSPPWANGGKSYKYPPTDMAAWSNYVSTVCSRYSGRITAWEIWNEQNIKSFWLPAPNPRQYVQILGYASNQIRKVSPSARVIMGGVAGLGQKYLKDCLAVGAADYVDAIAYHPYYSEVWGFYNPFDTKPNEARCRQVLQDMRSMISTYTSRKLEIWLTELGWNTGGCFGAVDCATQAAYMLRTFINYASLGVDKVFYYSLWDEYPVFWWPRFGLLKNDFTAKDAFSYYNSFLRTLGTATAAAPSAVLSTSCSKPSTLEVHPFNLPDGTLVVAAWKTDNLNDTLTLQVEGSAVQFPLQVNPSAGAATSLRGVSRSASDNITVGNVAVGKVPVMLEFRPQTAAATGAAQQ